MARITLRTLAIENLGPFCERQTIDFSVSNEKPIVLIKALNGSGKTTLLTALQVGLYGYKAFPNLKRSEYEQLILGLKRHDMSCNSTVEISLDVENAIGTRKLVVRREWFMHNEALREQLSVSEEGHTNSDLADDWEEIIGNILPAELVQLFLFDGEKIEALANPERLPQLLKHATELFFGIGGIDTLVNDLKALERRTAQKHKDNSKTYEEAHANLLKWEKQSKELERRVAILTQEKAAAQNAADRAEVLLNKYTTEAQRKGALVYRHAMEIDSQMDQARRATSKARANLVDAIADPILPITWILPLWSKYKQVWEEGQQITSTNLLYQEFKKRDQRILTAIEKELPLETAMVVRQFFDTDRENYARNIDPQPYHLLDTDPKDIEYKLNQARAFTQQQLDQVFMAQVQLSKAEMRSSQIPASEQVFEILSQLSERSKAASAASIYLTNAAQQLEEARNELNHVRIRLKGAQDRISTEFRDQSMETKSLGASVRARKALALFKDRLLASKAQWFSNVITLEFQKLLHKRNFVTNVIVDPETYRVSIRDSHQHELVMDRLSAGERQLLATSVLSALIKEHKSRFPVVIDTPLARLDKQHRSSLINGFFATISHQVIILSTDQEVEGQAQTALSLFNSQEYELKFDDHSRSTTASRIEKAKID